MLWVIDFTFVMAWMFLNTIARSFKTGKCMIPNDKVMFICCPKIPRTLKKNVRPKLRQFGVSSSFYLFPWELHFHSIYGPNYYDAFWKVSIWKSLQNSTMKFLVHNAIVVLTLLCCKHGSHFVVVST